LTVLDCWLVLKIVIPCVVGGILLILLIIGIVCYCRRRKSNPKKDKSGILSYIPLYNNFVDTIVSISLNIIEADYVTLEI